MNGDWRPGTDGRCLVAGAWTGPVSAWTRQLNCLVPGGWWLAADRCLDQSSHSLDQATLLPGAVVAGDWWPYALDQSSHALYRSVVLTGDW